MAHHQPTLALLTITRHQVETLDPWVFEQIWGVLQHPDIDAARFVVDGYDTDPRPLWNVPEFVRWAQQLVSRHWPLGHKFAAEDLALLAQAVADPQPLPGGQLSVNRQKYQAAQAAMR